MSRSPHVHTLARQQSPVHLESHLIAQALSVGHPSPDAERDGAVTPVSDRSTTVLRRMLHRDIPRRAAYLDQVGPADLIVQL